MDNLFLQDKLIEHFNTNKGPLYKEDFEFLFYIKWRGLLQALFETTQDLYIKLKNLEINNSELEQDEQYNQIMQILKELFNIIGEVNAHNLSEQWSFGKTLIAYFYSLRKEKKETRLDLFIVKVENYLARKIIIQQSIPTNLLDAENEDHKLARKLRATIGKLRKAALATDTEETINKKIAFEDFVVRTFALKCVHSHEIEQLQAALEVMTAQGEIQTIIIPAAYCNDCSCYFILESDYQKARQLGVLLCQQITEEAFKLNGEELLSGEKLKPESLLFQCGYNVNSNENLSSSQRHEILKRVIDNGLYSISGICSHLDWLISRNKKVNNRDMSSAISKWEEDRNYVANLKATNNAPIKVNKLYT